MIALQAGDAMIWRERELMTWQDLVDQSHELAVTLMNCVAHPPYNDSERIRLSDVLCSLSFEHAHAARILVAAGFLPSALTVHRTQFETILRSMWVFFAANDNQLAKLGANLTVETEKAASGVPLAAQMMAELSKKAPPNAFKPLNDFKTNGWPALNSYVHAGIHPIRRHQDGYPSALLEGVIKNVNALTGLSAMHAAVLTGIPNLQQEVLAIAARYPSCLTYPEEPQQSPRS